MDSIHDRAPRLIALGLAGLLFLTPLAFGGVHGWASAAMELCLWALACAWFLARTSTSGEDGSARLPRVAAFSLAALFLYLGFQLLPLPAGLLEMMSPATAELYRHTIGALEPVGSRPLAIYPYAAASDLLRYLAYAAALWLAATLPLPALVFRAAAAAGIAVAALALAQFATWNGHLLWFFDPYDTGPLGAHPQMLGPFVNPDHLAAFLAMALPLGGAALATIARRLDHETRRERSFLAAILLAVGLAVVVAALLGTSSRAGLVGAALGTTLLGAGIAGPARRRAAASRARRRESRAQRIERPLRRSGPLVLTGAILLAGLSFAGSRGRAALEARVAETVSAPDLEIRAQMWRQSLPIVRDFPWFGVGAGCWREVFRRYQRYPIVGRPPNHAHNDYLEWLAEVGLAGMFLSAALAGSIALSTRRNRTMPDAVRWGLLGSVAAIAWHEAFDFSLRVPANALLFVAVLGLLCNRSWGGTERCAVEEQAGARPILRRRATPAAALALAACALLSLASLRQLGEFLQWTRVGQGSTTLASAPADAETWYELGTALTRRSGAQAAARQCFRAAVLLRPSSEKSFWQISLAAPTPAAKRIALETALYLDPTRAPWRLAYARIVDADGEPERAMAELEEAVYRDPRLPQHPYLRGGERVPEPVLEAAERGFRRALADRPEDVLLLDTVAEFYHRFEVWHEAAALWERAAEQSGNWAYYGRYAGASYARASNSNRAETVLRRAIHDGARHPEAYRLLAMSVLRPERRYSEAEQVLKLGIRRCGNPARLTAALRELEHEQGKEDKETRR